ncbi:hypothetical protein HOLleu_42890 [Holothuria leucospilota]|uniref:Uncharacterized protein n=1 Tax=Holothuria leucospilota TaxID=206669 RepID=A0A9Q0YCB0_HOLLE|nr:hypothetical protein HOLleu_42890 [Holothuria leucospilota]
MVGRCRNNHITCFADLDQSMNVQRERKIDSDECKGEKGGTNGEEKKYAPL